MVYVQKKENQSIEAAERHGVGKTARLGICLGIFCLTMIALVVGAFYGFLLMDEAQERARMRAVVERNVFYAGISVAGVDVSNMTYDEARLAVGRAVGEQAALRSITVAGDGREWTFAPPGTAYIDEALSKAYAVARMGTLEDRFAIIEALASDGRAFDVVVEDDLSGLDAFIQEVAQNLETAPVNAALADFDPVTKTFAYTDGTPGTNLDAVTLQADITAALSTEAFPVRVEAKLIKIPPAVTKADLAVEDGPLSSFSTKTTSDSNRNTNIQIASSSFDGRVLMPGEVFSFNESTGKRTAELGYKTAGAIRNGKEVKEIGGGVCQVSTTLFNAVVRAGLTIVERNNHSYPISYVPRGVDAMVDYPGSDLQFRNDGDGPVYLAARFEENVLTIEVYGHAILDEGVTVELNPVTTATIAKPSRVTRYDGSAANGERTVERTGRSGYRVTTYIQYVKDGEVIQEEELFKSNYSAIAELVVYGTRL